MIVKSDRVAAGAKALGYFAAFSARLKSCPDTKPDLPSGDKARAFPSASTYGLKPVPFMFLFPPRESDVFGSDAFE
jgi:hypothetical protein